MSLSISIAHCLVFPTQLGNISIMTVFFFLHKTLNMADKSEREYAYAPKILCDIVHNP